MNLHPGEWREEESQLDPAALDDVAKSTAEAIGLPNPAYTSQAFFALERERLFWRSWVCVGYAHQVPDPGDALPITALDTPLVMVRARDGQIRVFHNVCSHRGARVITEPCKRTPTLRCPYHSWAYDHEGRLVATPHVGGYKVNDDKALDKGQLGLRPVRSGVWNDFVFVNMSGDAVDLENYLKPLADYVQGYDLSALRFGGRQVYEAQANWKLVIENGAESYHLPWVHPQLAISSKLADHFDVIGERIIGQAYKTAATPLGSGLPGYPNLLESLKGAAGFILLFPSFKFVIMPNHLLSVVFIPLAHDRTVFEVNYYFVGDGATDPALAVARQTVFDYFGEIYPQDLGICEEMQRGRHSPAYNGGRFAPAWDAAVHRFHQMVAEAIRGS